MPVGDAWANRRPTMVGPAPTGDAPAVAGATEDRSREALSYDVGPRVVLVLVAVLALASATALFAVVRFSAADGGASLLPRPAARARSEVHVASGATANGDRSEQGGEGANDGDPGGEGAAAGRPASGTPGPAGTPSGSASRGPASATGAGGTDVGPTVSPGGERPVPLANPFIGQPDNPGSTVPPGGPATTAGSGATTTTAVETSGTTTTTATTTGTPPTTTATTRPPAGPGPSAVGLNAVPGRSTAVVRWQVDGPTGDLIGFVVTWVGGGRTFEARVSAGARSSQADGLAAGTVYVVEVAPITSAGRFAAGAASVTLTTLPADVGKPKAPTNLAISAGPGSLTVTWSADPADAATTQFFVSWGCCGSYVGGLSVDRDVRSYTIAGLRSGVDYTVEVQALGADLVGDVSTKRTIHGTPR